MLSDRLLLLATAVGPMSLRSKPAQLHLQGRSIYDSLSPTILNLVRIILFSRRCSMTI